MTPIEPISLQDVIENLTSKKAQIEDIYFNYGDCYVHSLARQTDFSLLESLHVKWYIIKQTKKENDK